MSGFVSGLELAILSLVLLFAWLAVAVYASADLAFAVGLGVVAIWFFFFVPSGLIREMLWQSRQKKLMRLALAQAPAYQPGSALPPPLRGNDLTIVNPSGGAVDLYRDDLPQLLPQLEPRSHASAFKRSLVLPILGTLMMLGSSNDTFMKKLLEARGVMHTLPIAWEQITLPATHQDKRAEQEEAARAVLGREGSCAKIIRGNIAALEQFRPNPEAQIAEGKYAYEFYCEPPYANASPFLAWITPEEIDRGSFAGLASQFSDSIPLERATSLCQQAANKQLAPLQARLGPPASALQLAKPVFHAGRMPYADHARLVTLETIARADNSMSLVNMSCWVNVAGEAQVRFYKVN